MDQILQGLGSPRVCRDGNSGQARKSKALPAEDLGGPAFALGAAAAYEAENSAGKDRAKLFLLASRYLEEANNRGFPPNRNAEGLYLLGKSLSEQPDSGQPSGLDFGAENLAAVSRRNIRPFVRRISQRRPAQVRAGFGAKYPVIVGE